MRRRKKLEEEKEQKENHGECQKPLSPTGEEFAALLLHQTLEEGGWQAAGPPAGLVFEPTFGYGWQFHAVPSADQLAVPLMSSCVNSAPAAYAGAPDSCRSTDIPYVPSLPLCR